MNLTIEGSPGDLALMLGTGEDIGRGMAALSAAESLTDELAAELLRLADAPDWLLFALHQTDLVMERNSEWNFVERARRPLLNVLSAIPHLHSRVHTLLYTLAAIPASRDPFEELPHYLVRAPGLAYHEAELNPEAALREYVKIAIDAPVRDQWLGSRLAFEQQERKVLPSGLIELSFLDGMLAYREGRKAEAIRILRPVANDLRREREVAIAAHIVGCSDARHRRDNAEDLLQKSLDIGAELGDKFHQAQVLHTLGQLVGRDKRRAAEAEDLLRKSLDIGAELGEKFHQAQVLYSLGKAVKATDRNQAIEYLRQSLELNEKMNYTFGERVVRTLLDTLE